MDHWKLQLQDRVYVASNSVGSLCLSLSQANVPLQSFHSHISNIIELCGINQQFEKRENLKCAEVCLTKLRRHLLSKSGFKYIFDKSFNGFYIWGWDAELLDNSRISIDLMIYRIFIVHKFKLDEQV